MKFLLLSAIITQAFLRISTLTIPHGTQYEAQKILQRHNIYRQCHGAPPLELDEFLSRKAQNCANSLAINHPKPSVNGSNVFADSISSFGDETRFLELFGVNAVDQWYEEQLDYPEWTPSKFTQLVWKASKRLGVGIARSSDGQIHLCCKYEPAGNVPGYYKKNVTYSSSLTELQIENCLQSYTSNPIEYAKLLGKINLFPKYLFVEDDGTNKSASASAGVNVGAGAGTNANAGAGAGAGGDAGIQAGAGMQAGAGAGAGAGANAGAGAGAGAGGGGGANVGGGFRANVGGGFNRNASVGNSSIALSINANRGWRSRDDDRNSNRDDDRYGDRRDDRRQDDRRQDDRRQDDRRVDDRNCPDGNCSRSSNDTRPLLNALRRELRQAVAEEAKNTNNLVKIVIIICIVIIIINIIIFIVCIVILIKVLKLIPDECCSTGNDTPCDEPRFAKSLAASASVPQSLQSYM